MSATNPASKFKDWQITLKNGALLTGIANIPESLKQKASAGGPLLVGIHGGTCCAHIYDLSPEFTASIYSDLLAVPFVSFNRPNFLDSSGWLIDRTAEPPTPSRFPAAEGLTYFEEEARWFHELIFPALWKEFALPNGCTSIVTTSHSMAVMPTIIASTLYSAAQLDQSVEYVWAGIIISGLALHTTKPFEDASSKLGTNEYDANQLPVGQDFSLHTPPYYSEDKTELMLGPSGLTEPSIRPLIWKQTTPLFIGEVVDLSTTWPQNREGYQSAVKIPILYGLGEYDWIWQGNKENVEAFCSGFTSSPRVEGAVIEGAPHAIELSKVGAAWWIRVIGWATEVDMGQQIRTSKPPAYS